MHLTQQQLKEKLNTLDIELGDLYLHFKSNIDELKFYKIVEIGIFEKTEEITISYKALYGEKLIWVRTLNDFKSYASINGKSIKRFIKISRFQIITNKLLNQLNLSKINTINQKIMNTTTQSPTKLYKRNGNLVDFDKNKITEAIYKAAVSVGGDDKELASKIADQVVVELYKKFDGTMIPNVENVQDTVEKILMESGHTRTAKAYILYRYEKAKRRENSAIEQTSEEDKNLYRESSKVFRNKLAELVYFTNYSKWIDEKHRRETWIETVDRFMNYMKEELKEKLSEKDFNDVRDAMIHQKAIPSMRLLWSSGPAVRTSNVTAYNCSFIAISDFQDFGEIMYISMCGTGVGFSVEKKNVEKFPIIKKQTGQTLIRHVIGDSKEGWADAFVLGLKTWFDGNDIDFDYSQIRPQGARLKTMGGRASGPKPLMELMDFTKKLILERQGERLSSIDIHDIACMIGQIVVAGGVRRSAMISLSDLNDDVMKHAKDGQFYLNHVQRMMANNSAIYEKTPTDVELMDEWLNIAKSGTGERGIFNRAGLKTQLPARRAAKFEDFWDNCGTNPCGEIILRSKQFCNLTAIVCRKEDTLEDLKEKIRIATILGTYQAKLTKFNYLSPEWKKNCDEEALLGVSFTGYYDNEIVRQPEVLKELRELAIKYNKEYAAKFGINESTCITCVKPSGNSSQLLDSASGMHPRYGEYYIRRVRLNSYDPVCKMLREQGFPHNPEVGQDKDNATTYVFDFPIKAPDGAITKDQVSAIELLEEWKKIKVNFTEHNPSASIYVGKDEWIDVLHWIRNNWTIVGGLTMFPRSDNVYQLAPYEEITKERYEELAEKLPELDFSKLIQFERDDETKGAKEYACVGGNCEI